MLFPSHDPIAHQSPTNANLKSSSHAILAVLNEFCNKDAAEQISRAKKKGLVTMSIGDSICHKVHAEHNCLKINTSREAKRNIDTGINMPRDLAAREAVKKSLDPSVRTVTCTDGAENCSFPADMAYAMHSAYDIKPKKVAEIFLRHNLKQMIVYMYIPHRFYHKELDVLDPIRTHLIFEKPDTVHFTMGDFSLPYRHSVKNWIWWSKATTISTKNFRIIIEHSRVYGSLHILTLTRVAPYRDIVHMTVPLGDLSSKYYRLPDRDWETRVSVNMCNEP